jgi:uncharacterized membrane protein YdbT with pleckstrin-like domain
MKPEKKPFILMRVLGAGLLSLMVIGGALVAMAVGPAEDVVPIILAVLALTVGLCALVFYSANVAFKKERYSFSDNAIRCERGGIFSQQVTDLEVRNITHVKLHLPWLQWKLFGTGTVLIESAGSASSEVSLRMIAHPEQVWEQIRGLMQNNGFSLKQDELLITESPAPAGVLLDLLGMALGIGFGVIFLILEMGREALSLAAGIENYGALPAWIFLICGIFLAGLTGFFILRWFDLSRRTYRVYSDTVVYTEGFLTRTNAFIPGENIADSSTRRNLIDRALGLSSVGVSCQGAGGEIQFHRLERGERLSRHIDQLVETFRSRPVVAPPSHSQPESEGSDHQAPVERQPTAGVDPDQAWTGELQMNSTRAVVGVLVFYLIFPLIPAWLLLTFHAWFLSKTTRYSVRSSSVRWTYKFLKVQQIEFSYDKITGVVVNENPIDRMFNTVTIRLWSIGTTRPMDLRHIPRDSIDLEALLRQAGIPESEAQQEVNADFRLSAWSYAHLSLLIATAVIGLSIIGLAMGIHKAYFVGLFLLALIPLARLAYDKLWCDNQQLRFHREHLVAETGIWLRKQTYITFYDVKKVAMTQYPFTDIGNLKFFAAGEHITNQSGGANNQQTMVVAYGVTLKFIGEIPRWNTEIDAMLDPTSQEGQAAVGSTLLRASQPALANGVILLVLGSLIIFPLLVLLPITLPWLIITLRRRHYRIENGRVVLVSGVLFKKQQSVLWSRIDALQKKQAFLNTILGNGSVLILTAGTSMPDLVLSTMPDFDSFHAELRGHYGGSST